MFSPKNKTEEVVAATGKTSMIGSGMTIQGEINSQSDIRIDGKMIGNVHCAARVLVGVDGEVEGNIYALQVDITGKVTGNIHVKEQANLRNNAVIAGDIVAGKLSIEPTVNFNGKCSMPGKSANALPSSQVVELLTDKHERKVAVAE